MDLEPIFGSNTIKKTSRRKKNIRLMQKFLNSSNLYMHNQQKNLFFSKLYPSSMCSLCNKNDIDTQPHYSLHAHKDTYTNLESTNVTKQSRKFEN